MPVIRSCSTTCPSMRPGRIRLRCRISFSTRGRSSSSAYCSSATRPLFPNSMKQSKPRRNQRSAKPHNRHRVDGQRDGGQHDLGGLWSGDGAGSISRQLSSKWPAPHVGERARRGGKGRGFSGSLVPCAALGSHVADEKGSSRSAVVKPSRRPASTSAGMRRVMAAQLKKTQPQPTKHLFDAQPRYERVPAVIGARLCVQCPSLAVVAFGRCQTCDSPPGRPEPYPYRLPFRGWRPRHWAAHGQIPILELPLT